MPESLHSVVFNFINEALAIFIWPNFDKDALYAMGVGIVLGLVILSILTSLPGKMNMMTVSYNHAYVLITRYATIS